MVQSPSNGLVTLDVTRPIWERFFTVAPLVIIGTREADGSYDLAPKHMAMPLGWDNYFAFVCTPRHRTYQNIQGQGSFTVSFPQGDQVLLTSLSAAPHCDDHSKPSLAALPTFPASVIDGVFLERAYLFLECQLERIIDGFGENSLIIGKIVAAQVQESALRISDRDDSEIVSQVPLLVYISPSHYTIVNHCFSFPFHVGFRR